MWSEIFLLVTNNLVQIFKMNCFKIKINDLIMHLLN